MWQVSCTGDVSLENSMICVLHKVVKHNPIFCSVLSLCILKIGCSFLQKNFPIISVPWKFAWGTFEHLTSGL